MSKRSGWARVVGMVLVGVGLVAPAMAQEPASSPMGRPETGLLRVFGAPKPSVERAVRQALLVRPGLEARGDKMVMASVVRRLEHLGPEAMATMLASLEAPAQEEILRAATVEAVGKLRDARAVPWLVPLTWKDQPLSVRKSAIGALGRIGTEQAIDAALLATRVEGPGREGLVMALAHARHVRVAHELSGLVRHASDESLAYAAAEALGMVASSYAWATPQRQASGRMPEVQAMAARALVDAYLSRVSASDPLRGAMESALAMVDRGAVDRALDERTLGASASDMERAQGLRRALGTP